MPFNKSFNKSFLKDMTPQGIREYIDKNIKGQGNAMLSVHIVKVIEEILDMVTPTAIIANNNTTEHGYQVPELTADQVVAAYNAIVAGKSATITDANGNFHLVVDQADLLDGDPSIGVNFWNVLHLTYVVRGNYAYIESKEL